MVAMEIEDLIKAHIETETGPNRNLDIQLDTSLAGIVDSSGVLELVTWIEDTFGFTVEIDQITPDDFGSLRRIADWIRRSLLPRSND